MDNQITQLVNNFATELKNSVPEFQELLTARKSLESNQASYQLWNNKEEQRLTMELLKNKGLPVSPEQESAYAQTLKQIRENPITMRYLKAINFANKISGKIGADLFDQIGANFAPRKGCA